MASQTDASFPTEADIITLLPPPPGMVRHDDGTTAEPVPSYYTPHYEHPFQDRLNRIRECDPTLLPLPITQFPRGNLDRYIRRVERIAAASAAAAVASNLGPPPGSPPSASGALRDSSYDTPSSAVTVSSSSRAPLSSSPPRNRTPDSKAAHNTYNPQPQPYTTNNGNTQHPPSPPPLTPSELTARHRSRAVEAKKLTEDLINNFHKAIATKVYTQVSLLVKNGIVSPMVQTDNGETPLLAAVRAADLNMVRLLLELGADVNEMGHIHPDTEGVLGRRPGRTAEQRRETRYYRKKRLEREKAQKQTAASHSGTTTMTTTTKADKLRHSLFNKSNKFPQKRRHLDWDDATASDSDNDRPPHTLGPLRAPLHLACSIGNLPIVRLLLSPPHSANPSIVSPSDGALPLRLAATAHSTEIVQLLPPSRAGALLRFRAAHHREIQILLHSTANILSFGTIFIYIIPRFLVWLIPKHTFLYIYRRRLRFKNWAVRQITEELPRRVKAVKEATKEVILAKIPAAARVVGRALLQLCRNIPVILKAIAHLLWHNFLSLGPHLKTGFERLTTFITTSLPAGIKNASKTIYRILRRIIKLIWKLITRIPPALKLIANYFLSGAKTLGTSTLRILNRFASLLHTLFIACATFFKNITLGDIVSGFQSLCHAIFISLPKSLWAWLLTSGAVSKKVLKKMFGTLGSLLWWIGYGVIWVVTYIPKQLGKMAGAMGQSMGKGVEEIRVFINPKRMVVDRTPVVVET